MVKQRGAALLSALFITAIAAVLATALAVQARLLINQAQIVRTVNQNYLAMQGVQDWAIANLSNGAQQRHNKRMTQHPLKLTFPTQNYHALTLNGRLFDQQALFNINDLQDPRQQWRLVRLLQTVAPKMDRQQGWQMVLAITAWLRSGNVDNYYLHQQPPYRRAQQPMLDIKELRLVRGVNAAIWRQLQPYITALPISRNKPLPLNINHVTAPVLQTVNQHLSLGQARLIVDCVRRHGGFQDIAQFNKLCVQIPLHQPALTGVATSSQYYLLRAQAAQGKEQAQLVTLLQVVSNRATTVTRIVWQEYE